MKTTHALARLALLTTAVLMLSLSAFAQETKIKQKDVPAAVIAAFKAAYPQATMTGFAREKENGKTYFEIESKDGSIGRDVLYNPDGSVAEVEETIAATALPAAAQELLHSKYPKAVVAKAEKTTEKNASGDKIGYEVILKEGRKRFSLEFDGEGKLKSKAK